MKRFKKALTIMFIVIMLMTLATANVAYADPVPNSYTVTGYTVTSSTGAAISKVTKDSLVNVVVGFVKTVGINNVTSAYRNVDDFKSGSFEIINGNETTFEVKITNLKYTGSGDTLSFMIKDSTDAYKTITLTIKECVEYVEPTVVTPEVKKEVLAQPTIIFSRDELTDSLSCGETKEVNIYISTIGSTISEPIIEFTSSNDLLLLETQTKYTLPTITPTQKQKVTLKVKGSDNISSNSQYIYCKLSFKYWNGTEYVKGEDSGKILVMSNVKGEEKKEEEKKASLAIPNLIIGTYSYGGMVEAGTSFTLNAQIKNTSKEIDVENVVATIDAPSDFVINGASNTQYFEKIEKDGTIAIKLPFKCLSTTTASAVPVTISLKYDYIVDNTRNQSNATLVITVPTYQKDRFNIGAPSFTYEPEVGMETNFTMDYVNKGRNPIYNLEVTVSSDIDCYNRTQRFGTIEAGKSGTIAFTVTPLNEGENNFTVSVSYEDANGELQEKNVPGVVNAMSFEPVDPGEWQEPVIDDPTFNTGMIKWIIIAVIVVAVIVLIVILSKRKKAKKAKKQEELMAKFDLDSVLEDKKEDK